jgi:hypothetical protein
MFDLFAEEPLYNISYLFQLETLLQLNFGLLAKIFLYAMFDIKIVYILE